MMKRRNFLKGLLATAAIPVIAKATNLPDDELAKQMLKAGKIMDEAPVGNGWSTSDAYNKGDIITMEGVTEIDGSLTKFIVTDTNQGFLKTI